MSVEPCAEWVTCAPSGSLRGLIDGYVGYRTVGFDPGLHRGLPSRHMTFVVSIGSSIDVCAQTNPAQRPERYRSVLSGLQASAALIAHDGNQEGVAIELSPLGCRALLGAPAAELWDLSFESADVMGRAGDELWQRLQPVHSWSERFDICDEVLVRRVGERRVARELARCWRGIVASGGRLSVGRLAAETGYSRQHLTRLFRSEFGLGPKLASRIVRFEQAERALRTAPASVTLAEVATACGYADQAHLSRDFVDLAGCPPRELLGEDLPILQDVSDPAG